jgi:hypothetical protein
MHITSQIPQSVALSLFHVLNYLPHFKGMRWSGGIFPLVLIVVRGTRWRSWLWHCSTNWKAVASIPACFIGIFH